MIRKTAITLAAIAAILLSTAGAASALTTPPHRTTWAVVVQAVGSGTLIRVDYPLYSMATARADKVREQAFYDRYCGVIRNTCVTTTIRRVTR